MQGSLRKAAPESLRTRGRQAYVRWGTMTSAARIEPNFIVAGAQRCGTTSLFRVLMAHPQIVRPTFHKGVNYFDINYDRGPNWYRGHFPTRAAARLKTAKFGAPMAFDASGYYMYHPFAIERLARALPSAKIVVMLRDPVERAYSAYQHERARGYEWESYERALELEDARLRGEVDRMRLDPRYESFAHRHHSYQHRGQYAEQLDRIFRFFPAEQVHVLESEGFFANPADTYQELIRFLGLRPFLPRQFGRYNARDRAPMATATRKMLQDRFAPYDIELVSMLRREPAWMVERSGGGE